MQIFAIVVSLAIAAVGIALFVRAIRQIIAVMKVGQPAARTDEPGKRTVTMLKESLGHTRMLQWHWVGAGHWFIFIGFGLLFFTLVTAFGQLFHAEFALPLIGHFFLWEWLTEIVTFVMIAAIIAFIGYRVSRPGERVRGTRGRFFGSTMWQAYFVELVILGVGLCIVTLRGLEYALEDGSTAFHYPLTFWLGEAFSGMSDSSLKNAIYFVSMIKILISFIWMITISVNLTMGVAWHRFLAFFNIWFKRESSGRTALGAVKPLTSDGKAITLDDIDDLDEDSVLGVGSVEDFSWKGILDFTSCTECGRCQSQCPAWNTDKPLSPKLLITALRDHAHAKAPYLQAAEGDRAALLEGNDTLTREAERPLVGDTGDDWFYMPENGSAVIDPDVLWSCTSCGACVQQCPVDIEHVDHIVDMRRYAILVESNFPAELNGLFKGLENKGNPWNMSPNARMDWAKGLDFEVKVVGETIESLDEVDWLFWVGCAGAYEDRAKKTTRAVAELLDMAGVSFGVLGNGETCTGDPARRAGNEFVFQGLAQQNAETFQEYKVKKVVSTCAHCFNTLKNEYKEFGVELEVVHHTQLLNRLVREGRLTPVQDGAGASKRSITYHDPCYIGRHNGVYTPPRELLQVLPGAEVVEMERNSERSFCCGAGGARMWMEENLGERINVNRTKEAVGTGADQIAVGCPFCRVMLSDGLTAQQAKGEAREEVEVLDVAQMLLASVKGESATKLQPGAGAAAAPVAKDASAVETRAEPEAGAATQTEETVTDTEDVGPAAKASGGSSLFDEPEAEEEPAKTADSDATVEQEAKPAPTSGGSLFDLGGDEPEAAQSTADVAEPAPEAKAAESTTSDLGSGGSLFDLGGDEPVAKAEPAKAEPAEPATAESTKAESTKAESAGAASEIPSGGSLFDLEAPEPEAKAAPAEKQEPAKAEAAATGSMPEATPEPKQAAAPKPKAGPASEIPEGGSLFDLAAPEPEAKAEPVTKAEPAEETTKKAAPASSSASAKPAEPSNRIPEGGSLFDIEAPEPTPTPTPAKDTDPAPESAEQAEPVEDREQESGGDGLSGAAISAAATAAADSASSGEPSATDSETEESPLVAEVDGEHAPVPDETDTVEEPASEPTEPEDEKPTSSSNGAAHQPKTDVDINESGSLFDL
jgi:Fe-S oxidoreductase